jgi:uncharacterized protein (TIGR03083 family)
MSEDQTSQVQLLTRASTSTRSILEKVTREQLTLPTPCHDWDVHDLIDHIVGATRFFADIDRCAAFIGVDFTVHRGETERPTALRA